MRLLWLHQFVVFDPFQPCFHLMFLRYRFLLWPYYLILSLSAWDYCYCLLYECCVLSLNGSQLNSLLGTYIIESESQSFFMSIFILFVLSWMFPRALWWLCRLWLSGLCPSINSSSLFSYYGREGSGLSAGHRSSKCPEARFPCGIWQTTIGAGAHTYFETWKYG